MKKEREKGYDLIRAFSMLGIIIYHYTFNYTEYNIAGNHPQMKKLLNNDWGSVFVVLFFLLSGATIYLNHNKYENPFKFYYKRWLSIFPIFYLGYIPAYIANSIAMGNMYWGGDRKKIIYTFLGIDGYLLKPGVNSNYYRIGEWFLGAILFLYLIYPLLRLIFSNKISRIIFTVIMLFVFPLSVYGQWIDIAPGKSLITVTFQFTLGMYICFFAKYIKSKWMVAFSLAILIVLLFVPINVNSVFPATMMALSVFILLMNGAWVVMKNKITDKVVMFFSRNSFGIFLLHHLIIYAYMKQFENKTLNMGMWIFNLLVILLLTTLAGTALTKCSYFVVKGIDFVVKSVKSKVVGTNNEL